MAYIDSFNYGKQGSGTKKKVPNNIGAGPASPSFVPKSQSSQKTRVVVKPASYDKSTWDTKTKVSQGTINEIKKMGMSKALGSVKGAAASSKDDSSAKAFAEGVRRLYGDKRYNAAVGTPASGKSAPRNAVMAGKAEAARKPLTKVVKKEFKNNTQQKFGGSAGGMGSASSAAPSRNTRPKIKSTPANDMVRNIAGGAIATAVASAVGRKVILPAVAGYKAGKALAATAGAVVKAVKPAAKVVTKAKPKVAATVTTAAKKAKVKPVGTKAEYSAKARSEALSAIAKNRAAKKVVTKANAGKVYPGSKKLGTVNEFAAKAEQTAMRKEIQARIVKRKIAKK